MTNKNFSIRQAFKFAFSAILDNIGLIFLINLFYFILLAAPALFSTIIFGVNFSRYILFGNYGFDYNQLVNTVGSPSFYINISLATIVALIYFAILSIYKIGITYIALKIYEKKPVKFSDIFKRYDLILPIVLANIGYGLTIGLGFLLFVIPGIFLTIRLFFYQFLIIDKNLSIKDSFYYSYDITHGLFWKLFLTLFIINFSAGLINYFPLLNLFFATVPLFATISVYKAILSSSESN